MDTIGSKPGELSGHDVRRVLVQVAQMAVGAGLTALADNLGGLNLGPWQPVAAIVLTGAIDLVRRWSTSTEIIPVEPRK